MQDRDEKGRFIVGMTPHNKKKPLIKKCPTCEKEFKVKPSWDEVVCCSRSCAMKNKTSNMKGKKHTEATKLKMAKAKYGFRGEQHWNWKGGYSETYRLRRSSDYRDWRTEVFKRDKYTCQKCGFDSGYITAHHIKSFAYYPVFRFEVDNGITLCEPCHCQTDNYRGR